MGVMNLLTQSVDFIDVVVDKIGMTNLNWIGKIIQWLIEGIGIVGVGVIVFTLVLKTVVLPLDVYSRVSSKKQSLVMKKMRPQMEKLQQQYANDKQMYSQKVMELQKANGYSMFGACIPMIVSLVVFMTVFSAFSTYSQYANLSTYNDMVNAYNQSVQVYVYQDEDKNVINENGFLIAEIDTSVDEIAYKVDYDKFKKMEGVDLNGFDEKTDADKRLTVESFLRDNARKVAAEYYLENKEEFLWVGNIWYPDSMLNKVVPDFSKFQSAIARAAGNSIDASYEISYNEVTHDLAKEKDSYNGYFVLIILAIGIMFLQQFIMMRAQKDANELGSVDGSNARTMKWMMILMPIMYGVFSFFYSAAFSLYMITNTTYTLITTLIINKIMDVRFNKKGFEVKTTVESKRGNNNKKRLKNGRK